MKTKLLALICFALSACSGPPSETSAQTAPDLIDLLAKTNAKIEQFQYSPDGKQIAYVSAQNGSYDIWIMNSDGSNARALTGTYPEAEENPQWSPDGKWIAYTSRGEIFVIPADGSLPYANLTYGRGGSGIKWTPDGKSLIFVRGGQNGHSQIAMIPASIPDSAIDVKFISSSPFGIGDAQISPDGKWIAYTSDHSGQINRKRSDIWLASAGGGSEKLLTPNTAETYEYFPRWSPDGKKIAFVSDESGWRNIGVIDVASGKSKMLTTSAWDEANPQWSPDGKWIAYVANKKWNLYLMKIAADGGPPQQLSERPGVTGGFEGGQVRGTFRWSPDGQSIAYTFMGPGTCNDIWVISANGGAPKRLTNHMPAGLREDLFVSPEIISYKSRDGLEVPAFLYKPLNPAPNKKPPLLVYARANTHGMHVNGFYPFIQYFLSKGYVVLAPEVRGSSGNGREYEWKNFGDWGGGDIDDIASGVQYLDSQGMIDRDRVVMQGGSTGGYFTMQTIVRYPDLLKAAVNFYGPTNLIHMYHYYLPSQKPILGDVVSGDYGDPEKAPEHWRERSAIFNIDRIKTPLLILWGDRDYGVRISMADEYVRAAKQKSKPTDYVLYNNEPHGWFAWRPEDLKDAMTRVATHYQKYIGQ